MSVARTRCPWCGDDPLYVAYHDSEWGVPVHDDRHLFEMLILEGAQAGLSWITVLRKRESYREAFDHFDPARVARYSDAKLETLLLNPGIVRNRLKVFSARGNAQAFLKMQQEFGSFDAWLWSQVGGKPLRNRPHSMKEVPARTELSDRISRELLQRSFKFVGSTIVYAYLQAVGVVDDHIDGCWRAK